MRQNQNEDDPKSRKSLTVFYRQDNDADRRGAIEFTSVR